MNAKIQVAVNFVDGNLNRDIYVAELARLVGLSPSRFSHLFKMEVGMSFIQYLEKARLERARELLEQSFLTVKLISFQVGCNNPDYFERLFKEAFGVTPSQYRANHVARVAV